MATQGKFFDSKMIANLILAVAVICSVVFYVSYSDEIEDQVTTVIMNSINDANNSLAEQDSKKH